MIIVLRGGATDEDVRQIEETIKARGLTAHISRGVERTIIGAIGDERNLDPDAFEGLPVVEKVLRILAPFKLVSREFQKEDTVITVNGKTVGGKALALFAGPCSVEGRDMMAQIGERVASAGATFLRGGAFKPRTSPYAFQGLGEEGLKYLKAAGEATGMPVVSEIVSPLHVDMMKEYVDIFQIGARNMQNFELLKAVGAANKPVILKRGLAATIEELLMSAEYLLSSGTDDVILCERGIRTFETYTRSTLDLSAIPVVKKLSHLPIVVDPSHGTGIRAKVSPMALAAVAAGADGITVEVHTDPDHALSDGPQSLYPEQFEKLMRDIEALAPV